MLGRQPCARVRAVPARLEHRRSPAPATTLTRTWGAPSGPARARARSRGSRVRPGPAARGAAPAAVAPSPTGSEVRLALRETAVRAPARPASPPGWPTPAGEPTSLQQAADRAGVLRQERGPRHREQQLPGLYALPGHHAVAGHRALPAHRHLSRDRGGWGAEDQSWPAPAPSSAPTLTHFMAQVQPHAPAPAQEAGHRVRGRVQVVVVVAAAAAAAHRSGHLRQTSSLARPHPGAHAGGPGDSGAHGGRALGGGWDRQSRRSCGNEEVKETPARAGLRAEQREVLGWEVGFGPARTTHPPALCLNRHARRARGPPRRAARRFRRPPLHPEAGPIAPPTTQTHWGSCQSPRRR